MNNENTIAAALARAQATYKTAEKNGYNPHFKSSFATLEDLIDASRESLTREGISVTQFPESMDDKDYLVTTLMHNKSDEIITSKIRLYMKDPTNVQQFGSTMTYLKRYVYASICGIAASECDDDGNGEPVINENQVRLLKTLLKGDQALESTICKHYGVNSISNILAKEMNKIVERLKQKDANEPK
jgi:hypothetical protein